MPLYKGVEIDASLHKLVRHMASAESYRETLQGLQGVWDNLSLLGQLSSTGADMSGTREAFQKLTGDLINNLAIETLKKTVLEMKSKAQVAVDIMIRNLFERTADIGFLATDEDVRAYLEQANALATERALLEERFREYVCKYSVYSDIILLDLNGTVVAKLDPNNSVTQSRDPLIAESLHTQQAYVETARASDLRLGEVSPLIYSYRVTNHDGCALGVLCLCFRFQDEIKGIFANLTKPDDWSVILLLDPEGQVIASSDGWHIPVGARVERVLQGDWAVVRFAGREYLATTRPTQGYQGYFGPGWYGHVMMPLEHAFDKTTTNSLDKVDAHVLAEVMANSALFAPDLQAIPVQANQIQRVLNRSVWNGNVNHRTNNKTLNAAFSKILLWEISNTGLKTKDVFERSIANLHETVISAILENSCFLASLAIDIMDRNLYERANDCRWWALTSVFRATLAAGINKESSKSIAEILSYINGLYTVYDSLLVFDRQGKVIALSKPEYDNFTGNILTDDWVKQTLSLRDTQCYTVSNFNSTPLYRDRATYIYSAAIRSTTIRSPDNRQVVGGIAIVFDAEPQFEAMLRDALPRDEHGEVMRGSFGVFARSNKRIVSSTRSDLAPGTELDIPDEYFQNNHDKSGIVTYQGHYYAVGACPSRGYREYKGSTDAYRNEVSSLIFVPLGKVEQHHAIHVEQSTYSGLSTVNRLGEGNRVEIATFHVAGQWLGVRSECVIEAIETKSITGVPGTRRNLYGYIMYKKGVMPVINLATLLLMEQPHINSLKNLPPIPITQNNQIVVLKDGNNGDHIGLLVDQLGEIPEVPEEQIEKLSAIMGGETQLADSMVKKREGDSGNQMLVLLSVDRVRARLQALHAQVDPNAVS